MTVIQVRGTSGSGKSTVMRAVKDSIKGWEPVLVEGRKKPLYYLSGETALLGHYETSECGGCDTIGSARQIFEVIETLEDFSIILCEGLLLSEDTKWTLELAKTNQLRIIFLTTPVEECISRIKGRREKVGNEKPLNEKNTRNRVATIERARVKLTDQPNVECRWASSEQAPRLILSWLGYTPVKGTKDGPGKHV